MGSYGTIAKIVAGGSSEFSGSGIKELFGFAKPNSSLIAYNSAFIVILNRMCITHDMDKKVKLALEVYERASDMVEIKYSGSEDASFRIMYKEPGSVEEKSVPYSGYLVRKGAALSIQLEQTEKTVLSSVTCNGEAVRAGDTILADRDVSIAVAFRKATVEGVPNEIHLTQAGETYQLQAQVRYDGFFARLVPVYDQSIRYISSSPLVAVDANGLITLLGQPPENGKAVTVTAYAGSGNSQVYAACRVIVGNYDGNKIVGSLTVYARPVNKVEPIPHSAVSLTTYEDLDLNISYYNHYQPMEKYAALMADYRDHPEKYPLDAALYNDNALGLSNREGYFAVTYHGSDSEAAKVSLLAGESITVSNYSYDVNNMSTWLKTLENSDISSSENVQKLIAQVRLYMEGKEINRPEAFDSLLSSMVEIYSVALATGNNPANGHSVGGMDLNREVYNQFIRNDVQTPNHYYTVELTADELTALENYLSNPANNFYSLAAKNCATGTKDIWNAALFDKPFLHLKGNYTGFLSEPESMYVEIGLLKYKQGLSGYGGEDFCPHIIAYPREKDAILTPPLGNDL